jgi:lipoprotein-releasing system permease protein
MNKSGNQPYAFERFLAGRMIRPSKGSFSGPIMLISIISLVLGLMVMIISLVVLTGFKKEIREKVTGFTGHIHITKYNSNNSIELPPIVVDSLNKTSLMKIQGLNHLQKFITKAAIIRTDDEIHGVMVKGVGADFDSSFFSHNMVEGKIPAVFEDKKTNEILISQNLSHLLNIRLGDLLRVYFVNNITGKVRGRRFLVSGIYHTSVDEFDDRMVIADIRQLQKINNWQANQVSGLEVFVDDYAQMDRIEAEMYEQIPYDMSTETVKERYPQIFDWLELQDVNVIVILVLIILVATVSMISTLLVLILERTQMIGILKSLGARNSMIRNVFLTQAAYIIITGLFFGNLLGLGLSFLQKTYGIVQLDPGTYYMSVVPINMDFFSIFILNVATLILVLLFMVFPVMLISRIQPVKAISFD